MYSLPVSKSHVILIKIYWPRSEEISCAMFWTCVDSYFIAMTLIINIHTSYILSLYLSSWSPVFQFIECVHSEKLQ